MKSYILRHLKPQIFAVLFAVSAPAQVTAQGVFYRFTGTVEAAMEGIGYFGFFSSPTSPIPGLEVNVGDQVNGTFKLNESTGETIGGITVSFQSVLDFRVSLNGSNLLPSDMPPGDRIWLDDQSGIVPQLLESTPLASLGDAQTITTPIGGIALQVGRNQTIKIAIVLNFTESTGNLFETSDLPDSITLEDYDIAKGFVRSYDIDFPQNPASEGIMFNIDSIEVFDPNAPTLTTGYHVSWPVDAKGYILEEADSVDGPWTESESTPVTAGNQKLVVMSREDRMKFYRLTKAD